MQILTRFHLISSRTLIMPRKQENVLGVGDELGARDSYLVADLLPAELAATAFAKLKVEVQWQTMYHRGTSAFGLSRRMKPC
jgi:hypothetical protein